MADRFSGGHGPMARDEAQALFWSLILNGELNGGLMPLSTSRALLWQTVLVGGMAQWLGSSALEAQALFCSWILSGELNGFNATFDI